MTKEMLEAIEKGLGEKVDSIIDAVEKDFKKQTDDFVHLSEDERYNIRERIIDIIWSQLESNQDLSYHDEDSEIEDGEYL